MKSNEHNLADLINAALTRSGLGDVATASDVERAYRNVVGEMITRLTYSARYEPQTHVLYCNLASPALRNELTMHAGGLLKSINDSLGRQEVRHIVFR